MTWTKISDDHLDRRLDLSDAGVRLELAAIIYSNRLLLDGRIATDQLRMLPVPARCLEPAILAELVERGIWTVDGEAYVVADYFSAQPSREEVEAERAYAAVRQRIRYEKSAEGKAALRPVEEAAKAARFAARDRRRDLASQRENARPHTASHTVSHMVPVPVPARPANSEGGAADGAGDLTTSQREVSQRENGAGAASSRINGTGKAGSQRDPTVSPPCPDEATYRAHRSHHRRHADGSWTCDACDGRLAAAVPQ